MAKVFLIGCLGQTLLAPAIFSLASPVGSISSMAKVKRRSPTLSESDLGPDVARLQLPAWSNGGRLYDVVITDAKASFNSA